MGDQPPWYKVSGIPVTVTDVSSNLGSSAGTALSIVMPAYNEEDGIEGAVREVHDEVFAVVPEANLLVVNDGSKDRTGEILDRLAQGDKRIQIIHKKNGGHGSSLIAGLNAAHGEFVFLIDSDRQIPLSCFSKLWDYRRDYDAVFGIRQNRQDPKLRLLLSSAIKNFLRCFFSVDVVDANAPCKLVKRGIWDKLRAQIPDDDVLAPSLLLAVFAKKSGYKTIDVAVPHRARASGESVLKVVPLFKFCLRGLKQLVSYRSRLT
jgi:glycosyltransferase involved in cell wall biosynthesis